MTESIQLKKTICTEKVCDISSELENMFRPANMHMHVAKLLSFYPKTREVCPICLGIDMYPIETSKTRLGVLCVWDLDVLHNIP